jgi:hypothetical protein
MQDKGEIKHKEHWMKNEVCVFCYGQENGKPVAVCSRCVQKIICASPTAIANFIEKHKDTLTPDQLHFIQTATDEEVNYEFKARKVRGGMERKRTGRTAKLAHPQIRQMRAAQSLDQGRAAAC